MASSGMKHPASYCSGVHFLRCLGAVRVISWALSVRGLPGVIAGASVSQSAGSVLVVVPSGGFQCALPTLSGATRTDVEGVRPG
jgi:hypothetical protein